MRERIARFEAALVRETIRHFYLVDDLPAGLPPHPMWQAPLVLLASDEDALARAQLAARFWIRNLDLSLHQELVLVHETAPFTLVCQRPRRAGELGRLVGPIARRIELPEATRIGSLPIVYQEHTRGAPP